MSASYNFRTAFNGFNREDVVHYIEYINSKHTTQLNQLRTDLTAAQQENADAAHRNGRTGQQLEAEGVAHTLVILAAEELGGKYTRTGDSAENAQVKYEQQLVYNSHAAHLHGADLAHHDVIQQGNKIGDAVLDDNGQHHRQHPAVKGSVAYKFV